MSKVETAVNIALAACLRRRNPRWADADVVAEEESSVLRDRSLRPDVLVRTAGGPVVIEAEFEPAGDVDGEARGRIGAVVSGEVAVVESVIAVKYPNSLRGVQGGGLEKALEAAEDLQWYVLRGSGGKDRVPASGWLVGGVDAIAGAVEALAVSPHRIDTAADTLESAVESASGALAKMGDSARVSIAKELHQEDGDQTRRMAAAIVANAFLFQIVVSHNHCTPNIDQTRAKHPHATLGKRQVIDAWQQILEVNYWPIFDIARRVLLPIPDPAAGPFCELLASTAQDLAGAGAVEMQDLAGQMFGRLIVDRKFLGTYYTLPESATFLAELAVARFDSRVDWSDSNAVTGLRVADLACGTGALLSAAYRRIATRVRRAGGDDEALHTAMMEDALIGADVMPAAAHLATTMLSAAHPAVPFANCGIHVVPYGGSADGKAVKLGSLDLLEGGDTMSLFGREAIRLAGHAGQISRGESVLHVDDGTLDMCIMNPPFPRPTNHEMTDMPVPSFAGFNTPKAEQKLMAKRLKKIYSTLAGPQARDGNAGPASHFLDLAHRKLKPGGILALVVPATITAGAGWAEGRDLIDCHYNDVLVATLSELTQGSTSRAFSADTNMADVLVVATKNATTASSIGRCTVPVMMTGANTSTNRWRYQHARRTAGVARTRGDLPRAGRGSAGELGGDRPAGAPGADDGRP